MSYNTNDRLSFYGHARLPDHSQPECEHGNLVTRQAVPTNEGIMTLAMDGLYKELYVFWPDVIFFVSGFYMTAPMLQVMRTRRHKIVILHTESPYQDDEQMVRGQFADLNLLNDPVNIAAWRDMDIPVAYMPHAYDPDIHYLAAKRNYEADFAFIGTMFKSRAEFFSKMDFTGLHVAFGGAGWDTGLDDYPELLKPLLKYLEHPVGHCVDNGETARMYRLAKCGINFYRRESEDSQQGKGWAMGPREVEMAACGLFFLRDPRPESDEVFGKCLPAFGSAGEASQELRYWAGNDALREHRARQAYERIASRTFDSNARAASVLMEEAGIL
jgi:hypothetical protein